MIYVFDSNSLIDLFKFYYKSRFPTLWEKFDALISARKIISVDEVRGEIKYPDELIQWSKDHKEIFSPPSSDELAFVRGIFKVPHFQGLIGVKKRLGANPVADPFVIAKANFIENGCVVTQESYSENAAKIPNVCKHFGIEWKNLEGFMENENWKF